MKERGQALCHDGKWAMSNAALCFLLNFCFNLPLALSPAEGSRCGLEEVPDDARTLLSVSRWWPHLCTGRMGGEGVKHLVGKGSGQLSCSIAAWGEGEQCGAGIGGGLDGLSQSMLLLIPRSFKAGDVPHVLQAKPNPCVNGLGAASHAPHRIALCLGQLPLGFPNSSVLSLAFTNISSSDKTYQK